MAITKPPILVFTVVTKHYAYARSGFDGGAAEIRGDRPFEALRLGFYDSREVEFCVALTMKIQVNHVQHYCTPIAVYTAYQEFHTEPSALVACKNPGKSQADRIMFA